MAKFKVKATISDRGRVGTFTGEVSKVATPQEAEQTARQALQRCQYTVLGSVRVDDDNS